MRNLRLFRALAVACLLTLVSAIAMAQSTSNIRGTVTDEQGRVVVGATVTLTNLADDTVRTQKTNSSGDYSFELLKPGDYNVEVTAPGFKKSTRSGVHALVAKTVDADVRLMVGTQTEEVTVRSEGETVQVNTQDASLGNNFVAAQIANLPLEAKDVSALLTLQAGVTRDGYVAGARSDQSNITLDGVDINEQQSSQLNANQVGNVGSGTQISSTTPGPETGPVLRLNSDAIQEFRVTTMGTDATEGRSSGAQVNLVTKSGTNSFHGSAFEYHRNTIFTANDFFNNRSGVPRPKLIRNTFGGSFGGPIIKSRAYFFYSYEGRRDAAGQSVVETVPLPSLGQGILKVVTSSGVQSLSTAQLNQIFPSVGINPTAVSALAAAAAKYPANDFTVGDSTASRLLNTAGFRFNASTPKKLNSHVARFDFNLTSHQTAYARINVIYDHTTKASAFPDTKAPSEWSHPWGLALAHTWTIGNTWVNNARYGFTREAFTEGGDTTGNAISFRFIFTPTLQQYDLSRTTPVHNIVDDVSHVMGKHTLQFGGNVRVVNNNRSNLGGSYDSATTNPSGYQQGGNVVSDPIAAYLQANGMGTLISTSEAQNSGTALIGRFSQYSANFIFGHNGSLQPVGTPAVRDFATQGYEMYVQDSWKMKPTLTVNYGLRYNLSRPIYETHGFEVKPNVPLSDYFAARMQSASLGVPYNAPIALDLSGPANNRSPLYPWDHTQFQPRAGFAWGPAPQGGWMRKIFGPEGTSVLRGGFAIVNDYYGESLATFFDVRNTLGFSSQDVIPVNTYNVTNKPAPAFSSFTQGVRAFPNLAIPTGVTFPLNYPSDMGERIESSFDSKLTAPIEYTFNLTYERQLPKNMVVQASWVGRLGRHLLAQRDVMQMNDLVDPKSHMDWYTAATILEKIRQTRPPANTAVPTMAYFDNLFPANLQQIMSNYEQVAIPAGFTPTQTVFWIARNFYANDWTDTQADLDSALFGLGMPTLFFQPQYATLNSWGTVGNSTYSGLAVSLRQRLGKSLSWDFNYTFSHSLDDASGLQSGTSFNYQSFILNPIRQRDNYVSSGFDLRHQINVNGFYQFPIGRGHRFAGGISKGLDAVIGGWQLSGIYRFNTGLPVSAPIDDARWATNFNVQSFTTQINPVGTCVTRFPTPKLFGCNTVAAYQSFRNAYPGETGQRNFFRLPGYADMDAGLSKIFTMPYNENHHMELRWEVFNVSNTQHFGARDTGRTGYGVASDPLVRNRQPSANFSNFTGIQGTPRVMQVGLHYRF